MAFMRAGQALALLAALVAASPAWGQEAAGPTVTLQAGRLSVSASSAPLKKILAEISRLGSIQISVEARLESQVAQETITVAFEALPLQEGLGRLLRGKSYILVYSPSGLAEIGIYTTGTADFRPLVKVASRPRPSAKARALPKGDRSPNVVEDDPATLVLAQTEALGHPDPIRRISALDKLAMGRDQALGLKTALEVLARERDPEVLEAAMDFLVTTREPVPLDPILKMATDPTAALRLQALILLDDHGKDDPRVRDVLTALAREDPDPTIRETAGLLLKDQVTR